MSTCSRLFLCSSVPWSFCQCPRYDLSLCLVKHLQRRRPCLLPGKHARPCWWLHTGFTSPLDRVRHAVLPALFSQPQLVLKTVSIPVTKTKASSSWCLRAPKIVGVNHDSRIASIHHCSVNWNVASRYYFFICLHPKRGILTFFFLIVSSHLVPHPIITF